jgi:hypothetical protein
MNEGNKTNKQKETTHSNSSTTKKKKKTTEDGKVSHAHGLVESIL